MVEPKRGDNGQPIDKAAIEAVVVALALAKESMGEAITSNGIKFKIKPVPMLLIRQAAANLPEPQAPRTYIEELGREEENPEDPDYLAACEEYNEQTFEVTTNMFLAVGTSILEVPEGVDKPDDDGWIQVLEAVGIPVDVGTTAKRYLTWLQCYALAEQSDLLLLIGAVAARSGVQEGAVQAAAKSFRGGKRRGASRKVSH